MNVVDKLPDMTEALAVYRDRITAMVQACRQKDVTPVFVTQPVLWQENMSPEAQSWLWFGWLDENRCLSPQALRKGMERYNESLRETCRRMNVPCIDLAPLHGNESLFYDECHFNVAGGRQVAQRIATWFIQNKSQMPWSASR